MAQMINMIDLIYGIKDNIVPDENLEFIGHCITHLSHVKSQNFQDVWAAYENRFVKGGENFYVEFGATNGIDGSNTHMLEKKYYWRGILAEPNPLWHNALFANRNCSVDTDCVYTETGKTLEFLAAEEPDLSTIKGFGENDEHSAKREKSETIEVTTVSLFDMLERHRAPNIIGYMSVDTEGSEYDILSAFFANPDSDKYKIRCITVEHNFKNDAREKVFDLLTSQGYKRKFEHFSRWDDFYVKDI